MASLQNVKVKDSYTSLLKLDGNTDSTVSGASGNAVQVKTGDNDATSLYLNTDRLGIQESSPDTVLHVTGDNGITLEESGGTTRKLIISPPTGSAIGTIKTSNTSAGLLIKSSSAGNQLFLKDDGKIGIGITSPNNNLDIYGSGDYVQENLDCFSTTTTHSGVLAFKKSNHASNSIETENNHVLGFISFNGHNSSNALSRGAYIQVLQNGSAGSTVPSEIKFSTSSNSDAVVNMILDENSRISLSNNDDGTSNTVFGYLAGDDLASGGNYNTFLGQNAGHENKLGDQNIAIGYQAMDASYINDTQDELTVNNIFIGNDAGGGTWVTSACHSNVGIGTNVMYSAMNGATSNTSVGHGSLASITTGDSNTVVGANAGDDITLGSLNVAIGPNALASETVGDRSLAIGSASLYNQKTADGDANLTVYNVGVGHATGYYNQTGIYNTMVGGMAGFGNASTHSGSNNTGIGYKSLGVIGAGSNNTAVGYQALTDTTDGTHNIGIGVEAGANITVGQYNIAIGTNALLTDDTGNDTIAIGVDAGSYQNLSGTNDPSKNTLMGKKAGLKNVTGKGNTMLGYHAGHGDTGSNSNNTAVGSEALGAITSAGDNTAIGYQAGNLLTTGSENTILGYDCDVSANSSTNQIVIGNNFSGTADNAVHIGNDTSHIRCDFNTDQTWDASSDRRQKKDIKESKIGLDFINDLKPCKYRYKSPSEFPKEWKAHNPNDKEPMGGSDRYYYGFIAQEVKESIDKHDAYDYGVWNVQDDGRQRVSREQFVVSLVKAVQELSAKVTELENKLK